MNALCLRLLSLLVLTAVCAASSAQVLTDTTAYDRVDSTAGWLTAVDWGEIERADRDTQFVLRLTPQGNFEEDAGQTYVRPSRYLLGRWTLDTARHRLTLGVDGLMASNLSARYRRGRDFFVEYELVFVSADSLRLRDLLTDEERTFRAVARPTDYLNPAERRKPTKEPKDDGPLFRIPDTWGGKFGISTRGK